MKFASLVHKYQEFVYIYLVSVGPVTYIYPLVLTDTF